MLTEVKQSVAWELKGELGWLVDQRPNMQRAEWEHRFLKFSPHPFNDLSEQKARQEMFDAFSRNGLAQRYYASELDNLITINEGWKPKIADYSLVCGAFPICDVGLCHHRSIEHRKGYMDKNGREVPSHSVRSFFGHRGQLTQRLNDLHKAAMDQLNHDTAIDTMLRHLSAHKAGFYILDKCPKCKKDFEALRVEKPEGYEPEFREDDDQGNIKFKYDIGVIDQERKLKAIIEALNTHKMGREKREYAESKGYAYIEFSVPALLSRHGNSAIHSFASGWLAIEALKLKIGHSGSSYCHSCASEIEKERAVATKLERLRRRISECEEEHRRVLKEVVVPLEEGIKDVFLYLDNIDYGFTKGDMLRAEAELANTKILVEEMAEKLSEIEPFLGQLHNIEIQAKAEVKMRNEISFCSRTGLKLSTDFSETEIRQFNGSFATLSAKIGSVSGQCRELLSYIEDKQRDLMLLDEELKASRN